jgi:20S proteasome alpha/beta subunit
LKENYKTGMNFDETVKFTLKTLKESINEEPTRENTRLAYIKAEDEKFHMCSKDEVEKFLSLIKEEEPKA